MVLKIDLLYLFIYISVDSWISIFHFILWVIICYHYSEAQMIPNLASEKPFKLAFIFFYMCVSIIFKSPFLLSGMKRCSRLILLFLSPRSGNSHFSKGTCLLSVEIIFRNQDLYTRCAYCYRGVVLRTCQWAELWNTHLYIYFSLSIKSYEFTLMHDTSSHWFQHRWVHSSFTSFPSCNSFHWQKNLALLSSIHFLTCPVPL